MANQAASFIPKNSERASRKIRTTKRIYLLSYISYVAFFGTLLAVVGTYLYANQVEGELNDIKQQVQAERQRFASNEVVDELKLLDRQLTLASDLVDNSAAPSRIFSAIETATAENISYSGFNYKHLPNRQFEIMLTGQAENFNQIIYQEELMAGSQILGSGRIVSYDYSLKGDEDSSPGSISGFATLTFVFSDTSDTSLIPYEPGLESSGSNFGTPVDLSGQDFPAEALVPDVVEANDSEPEIILPPIPTEVESGGPDEV